MYRTYDEIPQTIRDYIETVADVRNATEVPLEDINGLLELFNERYEHVEFEEPVDAFVSI